MKKHLTTLISGSFPTMKAKSLLMELIHHKINYHKVIKYSNEIRYEKDLEHSEKRISELNLEKQELLNWLNSLPGDAPIRIDCTVNLEAE